MLVPGSQLHETQMTPKRGIRTVVTTGTGERAEPTMLDDEPELSN